ncbi:phosphatidylinositol-specific phospholipase C/glycerophosphodiester phosphodiesterase family protein [Aneurinibacillus sp. Ricciae_BoGa-3]|uniref:phosphatidylinositol-specific phospholipase C/glycerophosphodiester phosphodiesterase family protein n=1 Tax=Aneurinibacillus sp. Ricciae_BoGa-3 TaxID=3022697 RepID=UPI002342402C|nr:phosphatidylinositol-specific phospholipase C/glycerophosphodiester phosphodiesterase family protein [Aneurinibacillus sp. Ricciae_BoGa-3]WCK54560.1 phosphatidylinositol-specific phospholipase C/glycerophosphodiester phosphodiesterase family protein [Aneurinibacillus sp. Ricciae_BoGa-3]
MKKLLLALTLVFAACIMPLSSVCSAASTSSHQESVLPLARTHAHNDYEHTLPLTDAIAHGFTSVEADVWLVNGELLVAHDLKDVRPEHTLKSLYLDPLKERVNGNHGWVYPNYKHDVTLLVDVKSEAASTYRVLDEQLRRYQSMITKFTPSGVKPGAITVIVSGNRARTLMENQPVRYAAYDGRMSDLGSNASNQFIPLISDNWTNQFTWMGKGQMPKEEQDKLHSIISAAHAKGQKVRFWATPDSSSPEREAIWHELLNAGVDMINTDDLAGLQQFLKANDPHPSEPQITWETSMKKK